MTIDSCYDGIIEKLTIQGKILVISKKLLSLTNNGDRVLHVYSIIESLNAFPKLLDVKKSEVVSTHYRNLGNQSFQKSQDFEAWQYYNLSLLHAPLGSENYAVALSNRSAVFVSLKLYKECLRDIEEIFKLEYPDKLKEKLTKRQHICVSSISKGSQESESEELKQVVEKILKLDGPPDPIYVRASSKLEVKYSEGNGRHVVAKKNINVGEILVKDVPYFTLCLKPQLLFSCSYCLSRSANLYPCENCCFSLYCSCECKSGAWKSHHATECPLMASLIDLNFTKLELLGLRTVIKARSDHEDWHGLLKTIEEAESNVNTEHHGQVKINGQWIYDSKYYPSIHTLESNVDKRTVSDIFQKAVTAAVFLHLLKTKTSFLKAESGLSIAKIRQLVSGLLLLHIMTSPTNMHGISSNVESANGDFVDEINLGSAPYAFLSLLNHSCAPNVVRFGKLGTGVMTLFALRPIKKGMQLFDNYGSHHAMQDRASRRQSLKFQYKFTCACEACIDNWPTYANLPTAKNLPRIIRRQRQALLDADAIEKLQKGDLGNALILFKPLCELTEALEPYAPCVELADCQEALKQCFVIFEGVVPYGYSKLIDWTAVPPKL